LSVTSLSVAANAPCAAPLWPRPEVLAAATARAAHGPLILISRSGVLRALAQLREAIPGVSVHYAVKACNEQQLLLALAQAGCGFELASAGELPALSALGGAGLPGLDPAQLLCGNPVRGMAQTAALYAAGVRLFAVDSAEEVARTARAAPGARLLLRVAVPAGADAADNGAWWPMRDTFGTLPGDVDALSTAARTLGSEIAGVCFHVGSHCTDAGAWARGVAAAAEALATLRTAGHAAHLLSLGGGFPAALGGDCGVSAPAIGAIGAALAPAVAALPTDVTLVAEPGRYLVASAGVLLTRVTALRTHRDQRWLQLDCGLHNGLIESTRGLPYRIRPLRGSGERVAWRIAGPSCDGADVLPGEWLLPRGIAEGDWLVIEGAAAYSQSRASGFNGLSPPVTRVVD
jgi:ornithine decarboxylase